MATLVSGMLLADEAEEEYMMNWPLALKFFHPGVVLYTCTQIRWQSKSLCHAYFEVAGEVQSAWVLRSRRNGNTCITHVYHMGHMLTICLPLMFTTTF